MPMNCPAGLQHVLEVVRLIHKSRMTRLDAVKHIAEKLRIEPQTVSSACTRSLGLSTRAFDEFLERDSTEALCQHLVRRFPQEQDLIEKFFANVVDGPLASSSEDATRILKTLFPEEKKHLRDALLLSEVLECLERWLNRNDLSQNLQREIRDLREKLWVD